MRTSNEEYKDLKQLSDRLLKEKIEMEEEFKQILLAIADEVESQAGVELQEYNETEESAAGHLKVKVVPIKHKLELQQQLIEEQEKTINELKKTVEKLKKKISRLENSKLGKIQRKWWKIRREIGKLFLKEK